MAHYLNVYQEDYLSGPWHIGSRRFAEKHIVAAGEALGFITVEEYEIVVRCLHTEHVYRVVRVRRVMREHPPEASVGVPAPVLSAIQELKAIEEFLAEIKVEKLPLEVLHSRVAEMEEVRA